MQQRSAAHQSIATPLKKGSIVAFWQTWCLVNAHSLNLGMLTMIREQLAGSAGPEKLCDNREFNYRPSEDGRTICVLPAARMAVNQLDWVGFEFATCLWRTVILALLYEMSARLRILACIFAQWG